MVDVAENRNGLLREYVALSGRNSVVGSSDSVAWERNEISIMRHANKIISIATSWILVDCDFVILIITSHIILKRAFDNGVPDTSFVIFHRLHLCSLFCATHVIPSSLHSKSKNIANLSSRLFSCISSRDVFPKKKSCLEYLHVFLSKLHPHLERSVVLLMNPFCSSNQGRRGFFALPS